MKIALIQINATNDKEKNIQKAVSFVHAALRHGAQFVLLPEIFHYRGQTTIKHLKKISEKIPGPSIKPFMEIAKKYKAFILCGSIYEKIKGNTRVYNASVLIGPTGCIVAKYRKINLFDAVLGRKKIRESEKIKAGAKIALTKVKTFKAGLTVCYDLRFPGLYQKYAARGAHVLCVPSVFTKKTGEAHWETLLRARAIENLCYVLAPNQIGKDARGVESYGNSMVVDPWGKILARASGDKEEVLFADISMKTVERVKKILPSLKNNFKR